MSDVTELISRAEQGDADAQDELGKKYWKGDDVPKDLEKAKYWFSKAATQGSVAAKFAFHAIQFEEANSIYRLTVPGNKVAEELVESGLAKMALKNYKEMIPFFEKAAEQGHMGAQYGLGESYALGDGVEQSWEKAVYWYTKAAEQGHPVAQNNLGSLYYNGTDIPEDLEKAKYWFTKAAEQGDKTAQQNLSKLNNYLDKNLIKLNNYLNKHGDGGNISTDIKNMEQGNKNVQHNGNGCCYAATCVYGSCDCSEALSGQVLSKIKEGTWDDAYDYINNLIDENPNCFEAYIVMSKLLTGADIFEGALYYAKYAIKIKPDKADGYKNRAGIYFVMEEFQKVIDDCTKAIEISPNEDSIYYDRGLAYMNIYIRAGGKTGGDINDVNKALDDYNKAIELNANSVAAYNNRASIYLKMGEFQKAIDDCTKAIEISPNEAILAYFNRGLAYMNIGEITKAVYDYNKVIELDPKNAEAYVKRGFLNSQLGNTQEAIRDFEEFLRLDPDNENAASIRDVIEELRNEKTPSSVGTSDYSGYKIKENSNKWLTVLLLSIFLGTFGVDRFYVGKTKSGMAKLLVTLCSFGALAWIWWIVDIIAIMSGKFTDVQGNVIR
jgi:TPR repeat protein/TM2 domain-containing membrane protein YozV